MGNLWLKIKFWTKITVAFLVIIYIVLLVSFNLTAVVEPAVYLVGIRRFDRPNFLVVTLCTSLISVLGWWLIRTSIKTVRQFRAMRDRGRAERAEKELADMKAKAAKLQTRPEPPASPEERSEEKLGE